MEMEKPELCGEPWHRAGGFFAPGRGERFQPRRARGCFPAFGM